MFTGIVTDIGEVLETEQKGDLRARIGTGYDVDSIDIGASIACDGVCLTVVALGHAPRNWFDVQISAETVSKTNLATWMPGKRLNLERALKVGDELGGHIVSGHVDGLAEVVAERIGRAERHVADRERGEWHRFRDQFHSAHPSRDDVGQHCGGRQGEPGNRHDGPLCRASARMGAVRPAATKPGLTGGPQSGAPAG